MTWKIFKKALDIFGEASIDPVNLNNKEGSFSIIGNRKYTTKCVYVLRFCANHVGQKNHRSQFLKKNSIR